ncbi:MAG: HAD-IIIA family hydrolase, partial [Candidatus Woesearchaeota archaeon]|nr:HAD-IIIA family hydrolase [Candidatus Woesearchaeota archaeon]
MLKVDSVNVYKSVKILSFEDSIKKIKELKAKGKKVGLCHGGFDMLHPGHVKHFESAKKLCDVLFVSVTSDRFVESRKGSGRPVFPDRLRAYMAASIEFVDYVVVTDFAKAMEILKSLKPSYYIKGPDFIKKTTPGITAEREAIKEAGGEMRYTDDPKLSTTEIIDYIKNKMDTENILVIIDRDGTIIRNDDYLGKNKYWKEEIEFNEDVVSFIIYLQTKYRTTKIVVSNQSGIARKFFDCKKVDEINSHIDAELSKKSIKIDGWQYCPDVDSKFAEKQKCNGICFDNKHVREKTKRKPDTAMVLDALKDLKKDLNEFTKIIVIGNGKDDKGLADNLK